MTPFRALVVDDDPDIGRLVALRLGARGLSVTRASRGDEALAHILEHAPDVVLLDVAMPGLTGLEVLERVRAAGRDTAIVMMTAFGSEKVAIDALRRGADDYLRKPFETSELAAVLDRTLERIRLRRENAALTARLDAQRVELEAELARAGRVQADLLPGASPASPGIELRGLCLPARVVGGDFYDWIPAGGDVVAVLGDVMGKGMSAALWMATVRAALRVSLPRLEPAAALAATADALEDDLARAGVFVTLFVARISPGGRVRYVDAGHGLAVVRDRDGVVTPPEVRGLPLGVLPGERWTEGAWRLPPGGTFVAVSDGATELDLDEEIAPALAERVATQGTEAACAWLAENAGRPSRTDDLTAIVAWRPRGDA